VNELISCNESLLRTEMYYTSCQRGVFVRTVVVRRVMRAELNVCSTSLVEVESVVVLKPRYSWRPYLEQRVN